MRSTYWDSIKGFAIVSVVIIHSCGSAFSSFPEGSFNWIFGITLRQVINFAVPIFFALSGMFSSPSKGLSGRSFLVSRVIRILPPYIVWTLISIVLSKPRHFSEPINLLCDFMLGAGIGPGYFIIVLLQFILLTPLIWKIKSVKAHIILMVTLSLVGLFVTYVLRLFFAERAFSQFPFNGIIFIFWYPFFHFGVFASMFKREMEDGLYRIKKFIPYLLILCLIMSLAEGFVWSFNGFISIGTSQIKISSFAFSFSLFLYLMTFEKSVFCASKGVFSWLGHVSYIIYLSHMLVLKFVYPVFAKCDGLFQVQPLFVFSVSFCTLALCALLILSIEHTPLHKVKKYLGL
jgi:peptidoglycan/LPS O-acetylase OafA/YrhL